MSTETHRSELPEHHRILCVTSDAIPGYEIIEVYGHCFGLIVRSRDIARSIGAGLKSIIGGELKTLTKNMELSRAEAVDRMEGMAMGMGANAVVAMRYDSSEQQGFMEVCAYGTAVKIRKLSK